MHLVEFSFSPAVSRSASEHGCMYLLGNYRQNTALPSSWINRTRLQSMPHDVCNGVES